MAATMITFVACGEKENENPSDNDTSLVKTTWHYEGDDYTSDITFKDATKIYHYEHYNDDNSTWNYWGTYSYDGSNGSATLNCYGNPENFTFTVTNDTLFVNFEGEVIPHTKATYQDPGDEPSGDNPSGDTNTDAPATISGNKYKLENGTYDNEGYLLVSIYFGSGHNNDNGAFTGNATVHYQYYDGGMQVNSYVGGYSYYKNTGSGTVNLSDVETEESLGTASFTISGETLSLQLFGETYTLTKVTA